MKISAPRRESRSEGVSRIICGAGPASSRQRGAGPDDGPDRQPECVDKTMEVGFAVSAQGHRDAPRSGPLSKSKAAILGVGRDAGTASSKLCPIVHQKYAGQPNCVSGLGLMRVRCALLKSQMFGGSRMGIIETSAALGACLLVLTVAVVLDRRPYRPGKHNYIPIMIIALAASLVLGRHLLSLVYM